MCLFQFSDASEKTVEGRDCIEAYLTLYNYFLTYWQILRSWFLLANEVEIHEKVIAAVVSSY